MKKVVLVQPKSHETWECLNIGYIAAFLKHHGEYELDFYSAFFDAEDTIINACVKADIVGFSCASPQMNNAIDLATAIKKENPKVWTVAGGVHVSALSHERFPGIDQIVVGEGETAMLSIAQGNREPVVRAALINNLDTLPYPDRQFIKQERQMTASGHEQRIGSIFSSRGCPFACTFCASHNVWGRKVRFRSPESIWNEFRSIVEEFRLDLVKFADDTFTLNKECVRRFCHYKIEHGLETPWGCNIRVDTVDRPLLELLWEAGCRKLWIGVESGSPKILKDMKKKITLEQVRQVFVWSRDIGFARRAYVLLGTPNETAEDLRLTGELLEEIVPDDVLFFLLVPYPGTAYYDPALHHDMDFSKIDFLDDRIAYRHLGLSSEWDEARKRLVEKHKTLVTSRRAQQVQQMR